MWIKFVSQRPYAVRIYVAGVNAVSGVSIQSDVMKMYGGRRGGVGEASAQGDDLDEQRRKLIQDYVVVPRQKYGIATQPGIVQQFVAIPTGRGYSVEAQVTGKEDLSGILFPVTPAVVNVKLSVKVMNGEWANRKFNMSALAEDTVNLIKQRIYRREMYDGFHRWGWYELSHGSTILSDGKLRSRPIICIKKLTWSSEKGTRHWKAIGFSH